MGTHYQQLGIAERGEIARLSDAQLSVRPIAAALDRAPSTISRELNRNASAAAGYWPEYAQQQAQARRWRGSRRERDAARRESVRYGLGAGGLPAQVSGRLEPE